MSKPKSLCFSKLRVCISIAVALAVVTACGSSSAGDPSSCTTADCLLQQIPRDQKPSVSMDDCKVLDGKIGGSDDDLGLICRLRVARALASSRDQAPCLNDDSLNPDWSMSLREPIRLRVLNDLTAAKHFAKHGMTVVYDGGGYNNSTIHDAYVFNSYFYDPNKKPRTYVSAASYICRSGTPEHYVPYFFVLKANDGPDVSDGSAAKLKTLEMEYVETPPTEAAHVVNQMAGMKSSDLAGYALGDVNGDGQPDVVLIEKRFSEPKFWLLICLFESGAEQCDVIEANTEMASDAFSPDATIRIEGGTIVAGLEDAGRVLTERRFAVRGRDLVAE